MRKYVLLLMTIILFSCDYKKEEEVFPNPDGIFECTGRVADKILFDKSFPLVKKLYNEFYMELYFKEKKGFEDFDLVGVLVEKETTNGPELAENELEYEIIKDINITVDTIDYSGDIILLSPEIADKSDKLKPALFKALTERMELDITVDDSKIVEDRKTSLAYNYTKSDFNHLFNVIGKKMQKEFNIN